MAGSELGIQILCVFSVFVLSIQLVAKDRDYQTSHLTFKKSNLNL